MKQKYAVKFFYNSDLRAEVKVQALNEVAALALALEEVHGKWLYDDQFLHFRIEMKLDA